MPGRWGSAWSPENLGAITEFIIWDYQKNDFVKCGINVTKEEFPFGMTITDWKVLFADIVKDIFKETPFEIPRITY